MQIYFETWRAMVIHEEVVLAEEENITLGGTKGVLKTGNSSPSVPFPLDTLSLTHVPHTL